MDTICLELPPVVSLAFEVLAGKWGNDEDRKNRLTSAGYDYNLIQSCVNDLCAVFDKYGWV